MKTKRLGKTNLQVTENSFGALPVQRLSEQDGAQLLRYAFEKGVNFYDTARFYTDSERKIGIGLSDVRKDILIATKSMARKCDDIMGELEISLGEMKTDYVDLFQLHNIFELPDKDDPQSGYAALVKAKAQGKCRFIGVTTHRRDVAVAAVKSGLYDTLQFPICYMSSPEDLELIELCKQHDVGLIAMKALSGGLISSAKAAYAFFSDLDNTVPIWGVQSKSELDEFLQYSEQKVVMTPELEQFIEKDKKELMGNFCRGCGYCQQTCPAKINIMTCARMILMLRRAPWQEYTTPAMVETMKNIDNCIDCGLCIKKCPYSLNTPELLRENYADFKDFCKQKGISL